MRTAGLVLGTGSRARPQEEWKTCSFVGNHIFLFAMASKDDWKDSLLAAIIAVTWNIASYGSL